LFSDPHKTHKYTVWAEHTNVECSNVHPGFTSGKVWALKG